MARWREIADDLRTRVEAGEFPIGSKLPPIQQLQQHYGVPGLGTIRQAQQLLVDEGLLASQQGVGVFVVSTTSAPSSIETVRAELLAARTAIDKALALLDRSRS